MHQRTGKLRNPLLDPLLARKSTIDPGYRHHVRRMRSGAPLATEGILFRWNEVFLDGDEVSAGLDHQARLQVEAIVAARDIPLGEGLGAVVLHHSAETDYLLVGVWYQTQEFWQILLLRDARNDGDFRRVQPGVDSSTMCVWEMAPVWHERELWTTYLYSARDRDARQRWLETTWETLG
jgi:hypothetical protein